MPSIDVTAYAGVFVVVLLGVGVAALVAMRDTTHVSPHTVWHWVWCPRRERAAMVEFSEQVQTGLIVRTVLDCPLRRIGERCGEGCRWEPRRAP